MDYQAFEILNLNIVLWIYYPQGQDLAYKPKLMKIVLSLSLSWLKLS